MESLALDAPAVSILAGEWISWQWDKRGRDAQELLDQFADEDSREVDCEIAVKVGRESVSVWLQE